MHLSSHHRHTRRPAYRYMSYKQNFIIVHYLKTSALQRCQLAILAHSQYEVYNYIFLQIACGNDFKMENLYQNRRSELIMLMWVSKN